MEVELQNWLVNEHTLYWDAVCEYLWGLQIQIVLFYIALKCIKIAVVFPNYRKKNPSFSFLASKSVSGSLWYFDRRKIIPPHLPQKCSAVGACSLICFILKRICFHTDARHLNSTERGSWGAFIFPQAKATKRNWLVQRRELKRMTGGIDSTDSTGLLIRGPILAVLIDESQAQTEP